MQNFLRTAVLLSICVLTLAGAMFAGEATPPTPLTLSSSEFNAGSEIPKQCTCKGKDISPALQWSGAPARTASFAIIVDDPDAPHGDWVHWIIWNVPAATQSLPEAVAKQEQLEDGSRQGKNDFHKTGYNGACPPGGQTHRYFFRLYALDSKLDLPPGANRAALEAAMQGHILSQAEYMGTFHK